MTRFNIVARREDVDGPSTRHVAPAVQGRASRGGAGLKGALGRLSALLLLTIVSIFAQSIAAQAQFSRTGFTSIVSTSSGACVDIAGMQTTAGAAAVQWPCQSSVNESFFVQTVAKGVALIEQQTGMCLTAKNTQVVLGPCDAVTAVWSLTPAGRAFRITYVPSGLCLTTGGDSLASNAAMIVASCQDPNLATWTFPSGLVMPTQPITFQADHSGQCMVLGASGTLVQSPCAGSAPEQWRIVPNGFAYQIVSGTSGQCLGLGTSGTTPGLGVSTCNNSVNQAFTLWPASPGYLLNIGQGCVDVSQGSLAAGAQLVLGSCTVTQHNTWSIGTAKTPVSWTNVIPLNVDPIAAANLPDGRVLTWSTFDLFNYTGDVGNNTTQTYTSIFDPTTLTSGPAVIETAGSDMFCPGTANLADGRILVNGGSSSPKTTIFDPATSRFTADALMNIPRGYEGTVPLSNGSVFTLGGSWNNSPGNKTGEVWSSGQGWRVLPNVPETPIMGPDPLGPYRGDNHLWLFSLSNGEVFQAGPSAQMNWINTNGSGSITSAGNRGDDAYSMNGNAVMYDVGKILKAGGAPAYDNGLATTSAYTINLNGVSPNSQVVATKVAPMTYARGFSSGVALPNGQVLISGGQTITNGFKDTGAVLVPELWDPLTGVFQQLAPMQTPRVYHSVALLLKDGRVFVGGGGQCGYSCAANHFDTEILTPPYLLNADGSPAPRPVITAAPAQAAVGGTMVVTTSTPVTSFVLMRNSSVTHTLNNDQRRVPLAIQVGAPSPAGSAYVVGIPGDSGVTLPGNYMLFAIDAYGVPSVAATVRVN